MPAFVFVVVLDCDGAVVCARTVLARRAGIEAGVEVAGCAGLPYGFDDDDVAADGELVYSITEFAGKIEEK